MLAGRVRPYLLLLLLIALPYASAIPNGFVWDDDYQISTRVPARLDFARLLTDPSWGVLTEDEASSSGGNTIRTFRPVLLLSFISDAALFGERAFGYHLTSVVLFALLGLALLGIARALVSDEGAAFALAACFCLQPLLTESVSWISGRHDVLMSLCLALDVLCICLAARSGALRRALLCCAALLAFLLALLSKEPAVLLPVVLPVLLWLSPLAGRLSRAERFWLLGAHVAVAAAYLVYRSEVVARGNLVGGAAGVLAVVQVAPYAAAKYMAMFAYQPHLTSHYLQARVAGFGLVTFWLPLSLHLSLLALAFRLRKRHWSVAFGLLLFYAMLAPSAVMLASKPEYSLRFLFLPSLGLIAALAVPAAALYRMVSPTGRRLCVLALALALALQASRIHLRNADYESDYAFYASIIRDEPDAPSGYYGLGLWFHGQGGLRSAEKAYLAALQRKPEMAQAYNNLGVLLLEQKRPLQAAAVLSRGIAAFPNKARLHYNLGQALATAGQAARAEQSMLRAIELDPGYRNAYRRLYDLYRATDQARAQAFRLRHSDKL